MRYIMLWEQQADSSGPKLAVVPLHAQREALLMKHRF